MKETMKNPIRVWRKNGEQEAKRAVSPSSRITWYGFDANLYRYLSKPQKGVGREWYRATAHSPEQGIWISASGGDARAAVALLKQGIRLRMEEQEPGADEISSCA